MLSFPARWIDEAVFGGGGWEGIRFVSLLQLHFVEPFSECGSELKLAVAECRQNFR